MIIVVKILHTVDWEKQYESHPQNEYVKIINNAM